MAVSEENPDREEIQEPEQLEGHAVDGQEQLPELLDLIDAAGEAAEDPGRLASVLVDIGRRCRATPGDRDLLSDFEGISVICKALAGPPHQWRGEAMLAFCRAMPDVCRTSTVNRGALRDEGFVAATVAFLRASVGAKDEAAAQAACLALTALCTANDGNKRATAQLAHPETEGSEEPAPEKGQSGMLLLLDALGCFPESVALQTAAISALRALLTDDDPRKADCEPSAVENREIALSDDGFPFFGAAVERALGLARTGDQPHLRLQEQALLLLREIARGQERIQVLAMGAKLLPRVQATVPLDDARVLRAALGVLRAFAAVEEVRDEIGLFTDGAAQCLVAVRRHLATPAVCEQGFGLFANLTLRKSPIAAKLNEGEAGIVGLGLAVLRRHQDRPEIVRSIALALRNVAIQDDVASREVKEAGIFEEVRRLVSEHEHEARWKAAVDVARQFLREFRADAGMEKKAIYNAYY
jgi:hypothetical protein